MSNGYVLNLQMITEIWQENILIKRFEIARNIYNACLNKLLKQYKKLKNNSLYRNLLSQEKSKARNSKLSELNKTYCLTEYTLHSYVKYMNQHFKNNIDANTAQKIATRAFKAFEKYRFGKAKKLYFKSYSQLDSVEGKTNTSGIRFKGNKIQWLGLEIPVKIKTKYEFTALNSKVKYCRILRKTIRNKNRFFIQLVLEGTPPQKREVFENQASVGLDIGTQIIAIVSKNDVKLLELAPNINIDSKQKVKLQRKMDRQRRSNNPNKYNDNGTIKQNNDNWIFSKNYLKTKEKLHDIQRKIAEKRRISHNKLANNILQLGTNIKVETMQFQGLQKKAKETTTNPVTGKYKRKKRFGKSISNKAPAMLLRIIDTKLKYLGKHLQKVNTYKIKASQYNHFNNSYEKKSLKNRWNYINNQKIQRDLYSAFLIMNVCTNLKEIDIKACNETFDNFKKMHDKEILRIKKNKTHISSMGI